MTLHEDHESMDVVLIMAVFLEHYCKGDHSTLESMKWWSHDCTLQFDPRTCPVIHDIILLQGNAWPCPPPPQESFVTTPITSCWELSTSESLVDRG